MDRLLAQSRRLAVANIAVALAVFGLKFWAYWVTSSVALYSDALESIVNVLTALAATAALNLSARPPDRHHQFGHHKAEYFSAVLEGVLIVLAAALIIRAAGAALLTPSLMHLTPLGIGLNTLATILNAAWSWVLIKRGRENRSPALIADGWHLATDVATSVAILAGLGLVAMTGWQKLDAAMALAVAFYILWAGGRLIRDSMSGLMDEAVTGDVARQIHDVIHSNADGAIEAHDIKTRTAGRVTFIEFHLVVPGTMTVAASHEICDRVEAALRKTVAGAEIVIHVEPDDEAFRKETA